MHRKGVGFIAVTPQNIKYITGVKEFIKNIKR